MIVKCKRDSLHDAVITVGRAAAGVQSPLPILQHVMLRTVDNCLSLFATDSELASLTSLPVVGDLSEPIAVPAKQFGEILNSLPDGEVALEVGSRHTLILRMGDIRFDVKGLPPEEFPSIPMVYTPGDNTPELDIDQATIRRMLRQTLFSVSQDAPRVQYTGVLFEQDSDVLRLVSSDGAVRVAVASAAVPPAEHSISAIVPARALVEFARILRADGEGRAVIHFRDDLAGPTLASFEANGVTLISRLIEGQFAPWRRVVPKTWTERATVKCGEMLGSLRRMAIVARDDQQRVQLCLKGDVLEMRCQSTIIGEAEERTFALGEGEELIIALHGRYLAEGIAALEEEGCYLEFTTSLSPCVVRPLTGDSYLYVQSPMHLR